MRNLKLIFVWLLSLTLSGISFSAEKKNEKSSASSRQEKCEKHLCKKNSKKKSRPETARDKKAKVVKEVISFSKTEGRLPLWQELIKLMEMPEEELLQLWGIKSGQDPMMRVVSFINRKNEKALMQYRQRLVRAAVDHFLEFLVPPNADDLAVRMDVPRTYLSCFFKKSSEFADAILDSSKQVQKKVQNKIIDSIVKESVSTWTFPPAIEKTADKLKVDPTVLGELITKLDFGTWNDVIEKAKDKIGVKFDMMKDERLFTPEREKAFKEAVRNADRVIVTAIDPDAELRPEVIEDLQVMAKFYNAPIIVRPSFGRVGKIPKEIFNIPNVHVMPDTTKISADWIWDGVELMPKLVNPLSGLGKLGERGVSRVFFAPQRRVEQVATGDNVRRPHYLISTGALTEDQYFSLRLTGQRTDRLAGDDLSGHWQGVLLMERIPARDGFEWIGGESTWNFRHVKYIKEDKSQGIPHGFRDLDMFFSKENGAQGIQNEALILGDFHIPNYDPEAVYAVSQQLINDQLSMWPGSSQFPFKYIVVHDGSDGTPISHWEQKKATSKAKNAIEGELSLETHVAKAADIYNAILAKTPPHVFLVIDFSNHDGQWTDRWLSEAGFMQDPFNSLTGAELFSALIRTGVKPYHELLRRIGISDPDRLILLPPGTSFRVGKTPGRKINSGVNIGDHGNVGPGGSKTMSIEKLLEAHGAIVTGHVHTIRVFNDAVQIPTLSALRPSYAIEGPSRTSQGCGLVGPYGDTQPLMLRRGWFYRPLDYKGGESPRTDEYPEIIERKMPPEGHNSVDQWTEVGGRAKAKRRK